MSELRYIRACINKKASEKSKLTGLSNVSPLFLHLGRGPLSFGSVCMQVETSNIYVTVSQSNSLKSEIRKEANRLRIASI